MLNNTHRHPAINHHVLSGDEVILHQRRNQRRNILWLAFHVQRNSILDIVLGLFRRKSIMKRRANDTRRNAVHPDTLLSKLAAQNTSELRQRAFHHPIGKCAQTPAQSRR